MFPLIQQKLTPVYFPQIEVIGDIANAIWRIREDIAVQAHWDFSRMLEVRLAGAAQEAEGIDDARYPIYPQRLVREIRDIMPDDGIICLDNGVYKIWFARKL